MSFLHADVKKEGVLPMYEPCCSGISMVFLPYNPNILIVGDQIAALSFSMASQMEQAKLFCFSSEEADFETLNRYSKIHSNIHPYFGLFYTKQQGGLCPYFPAPSQTAYTNRFAGSLLEPTESFYPILFKEKRLLPTFYLPQFCKKENLLKMHMLWLDCGGTELQVLKSCPPLVNSAIVIYVKTYHQPIRKHISVFNDINQYLISCGFELVSHYIYDDIIGDALYVKSKYVSAVFRIKEI